MDPEYRLDAVLSARGGGDRRPEGASADDELAPQLTAAGRLAVLRDAEPAPEFARALQTQLLARTEHLRTIQAQAQPVPSSDAPVVPLAAHPQRQRLPRWAPHTPRALWPTLAAAVLLALGIATFSATAHAGPQSPFYGIHRTVENAQAQLASSQTQRAQLHLQYADEALAALDTAARDHDDAGYATALATLQSETAAVKQTLATTPAGSDHDALANQVNELRSHTLRDLASALGSINWENRVATTSALGGLGAAAPHVSSATITRQDGQGGGQGGGQGDGNGQGSAGHADQVIVSGNGFEAGARLIANGRPATQVTAISVTNGQLVAVVQPGAIEGAHSVGVSNPDGTAAETTNITEQHGGNGDNGDNGGNGNNTHAAATPTATPDHGKGKHP